MMRLMVLTFVVLGWAFYEMSGGADFAPPDPVPAPHVARNRGEAAGIGTLIGADEAPVVRVAAVDAQRLVTRPSDFGAAPAAPGPASPGAASEPEPAVERRTVSGSRVNMREGPGTGFGVVDVLSRGEDAEVLAVEGGWARVRSDGREGWMALSLLSEAG